jgi:AsmA protein
VIDGPWTEPRIYPDMAGILDNPDAAYAKLKEMGKGLFGAGGGGLGGLSGLGGLLNGGSDAGHSGGNKQSDPLGGQLGETLGNLLQQGLGQGRSIPAPTAPTEATPPAPAQNDPTSPPPQDSQPMNDVLRQLFNR